MSGPNQRSDMVEGQRTVLLYSKQIAAGRRDFRCIVCAQHGIASTGLVGKPDAPGAHRLCYAFRTMSGADIGGRRELAGDDAERGGAPAAWRVPKRERPTCGARCRTRGGGPCNRRVACDPGGKLRPRCRLHGGDATGPRTPEGRARVAEAQRERWRCYRASKA